MTKNNYLLYALLSFTLLSGCATTYKPSVDPALKEEISNLAVVALLPQQEIDVQFVPSNGGAAAGMQFGAIGALVGSVADSIVNHQRGKKAEELVAEYRDQLIDYNFNETFEQALARQLPQIEWIETANVDADTLAEEFNAREYLRAHQADGLLVITPRYSFSPDLNTLHLTATADIYSRQQLDAKKGDGSRKLRPRYKGYYHFQVRRDVVERIKTPAELEQQLLDIENKFQELVAENPRKKAVYKLNRDKEIKKAKRNLVIQIPRDTQSDWTKERLEQHLTQGTQHIAYMAWLDLNKNLTPEEYVAAEQTIPSWRFSPGDQMMQQRVKAHKEKSFDGHDIYRLKGRLYSVEENGVIVEQAFLQ